jgi:hypothetical protein
MVDDPIVGGVRLNAPNVERPGEYPVPASYRLARCRSCQAVIVWTTTATGRPVPLSMATLRTDSTGQRFALNHFSDCPHAGQHRKPDAERPIRASVTAVPSAKSVSSWTPITMYFPAGALVPVSGRIRARWPDGALTLHFQTRDELYTCVLVTEFIRQIGGSVSRIDHSDDVTRVTVV